MRVVAVVCAIVALLAYLLALFGVGLENVDLVVFGHAFVAATLLAMNLPAPHTLR